LLARFGADESVPAVPSTLPPPASRAFGFNVVGFVSGNLGLGVFTRNVVAALRAHGFPVAVLDLDPGDGRFRHDRRYRDLEVPAFETLPYAVNLFVLPLHMVAGVVLNKWTAFARDDALNVLGLLWELPAIPPVARRAIEFFDVVLAFSTFVQHACDFVVSGPLVLPAKLPVELPPGIAAERKRFGIGEDDFAFVASLELASDPQRKNVCAAIDAFVRGARGHANARLIVHVNNASAAGRNADALDALRHAAATDSRVCIDTETLSYEEALSLYASGDAYVSLHRAEGFGLGPYEAMALGKPAIATAWSGNMTYMDGANACLVPYRLVPVESASEAYSADTLAGLGAVWADPDTAAAAGWMRRLLSDAELCARIGERARASIAAFHDDARAARFAASLRELWQQRLFTGGARNHAACVEALQRAVSDRRRPTSR
jgi:glycosyltransferase involved in cell wall biosynthesis